MVFKKWFSLLCWLSNWQWDHCFVYWATDNEMIMRISTASILTWWDDLQYRGSIYNLGGNRSGYLFFFEINQFPYKDYHKELIRDSVSQYGCFLIKIHHGTLLIFCLIIVLQQSLAVAFALWRHKNIGSQSDSKSERQRELDSRVTTISWSQACYSELTQSNKKRSQSHKKESQN